MEENRFFRYVWRFNAFAIALIGILTIVLLVAGLIDVFDLGRGSSGRPDTPVEPQQERLAFDEIEPIMGYPHIMIPVVERIEGTGSGSSPFTVTFVRNYVFIAPSQGTQHWLYHHNQFMITELHRVTRATSGGDATVLALLYEVVQDDTNGDGLVQLGDDLTIALTAPDGSGYTEPVQNVDELLGYNATADGVLAVLFRRGDDRYLARISLDGLGLIGETKLTMQRAPVRSK